MDLIHCTFKSNNLTAPLKCDAVAVKDAQLYMASLAGPAQVVRAIAAKLRGKQKGDSSFHFGVPYFQSTIFPTADAYHVRIGHLVLDSWHLVVWDASNQFLPSDDDETLWRYLSSPRFSTPIIRDWVPAIKQELIKANAFRRLSAYQCKPALAFVTEHMLDKIVSVGVKNQNLRIPE